MDYGKGAIDQFGHERFQGIGTALAYELESRLGKEARPVILGHVQRGGTPTAYDRVLATRFGWHAVEAAHRGEYGRMTALRGTDISMVPLAEAVTELKTVPQGPDGRGRVGLLAGLPAGLPGRRGPTPVRRLRIADPGPELVQDPLQERAPRVPEPGDEPPPQLSVAAISAWYSGASRGGRRPPPAAAPARAGSAAARTPASASSPRCAAAPPAPVPPGDRRERARRQPQDLGERTRLAVVAPPLARLLHAQVRVDLHAHGPRHVLRGDPVRQPVLAQRPGRTDEFTRRAPQRPGERGEFGRRRGGLTALPGDDDLRRDVREARRRRACRRRRAPGAIPSASRRRRAAGALNGGVGWFAAAVCCTGTK